MISPRWLAGCALAAFLATGCSVLDPHNLIGRHMAETAG